MYAISVPTIKRISNAINPKNKRKWLRYLLIEKSEIGRVVLTGTDSIIMACEYVQLATAGNFDRFCIDPLKIKSDRGTLYIIGETCYIDDNGVPIETFEYSDLIVTADDWPIDWRSVIFDKVDELADRYEINPALFAELLTTTSLPDDTFFAFKRDSDKYVIVKAKNQPNWLGVLGCYTKVTVTDRELPEWFETKM